MEIKPHIKLVEKEVKTIEPKVGIKPLVIEHVEITKIVVKEIDV